MTHRPELIQVPDLNEAALEAQWRGVRRRRAARSRRRRGALAGVTATLAVALIATGAWWTGLRSAAVDPGASPGLATVEDREGSERSATTNAPPMPRPQVIPAQSETSAAEVKIANGAVFRAAPGARVETCEDDPGTTCLRVHTGTVDFEPGPAAAPIVVRSGAIELRSKAAHFVISRKVAGSAHFVELRVERGEVEVFRASSRSATLTVGETLSVEEGDDALEAIPPGAPPNASEDPDASTNPESKRVDGSDDAGQSLWTRAKEARRAGDHSKAAELYARLMQEGRSDPQVGLAALELARIRMDTLDDLQGAIGPLESALKDRRASIREDALARLVRAHEGLGQRKRCDRRRSQYLALHPEGVHTAVVERACGHE